MRQRIQMLTIVLLVTGLMASAALETAAAMVEGSSTEKITMEITIKHSGLFSRKTTTIEYLPGDKSIIAVRENGKRVAEEELERYRQMLGEALEMSALQDLDPELDAANRTFETFGIPDSEKFEELRNVMGKLDGLESEFAKTQRELLTMRQKLIQYGVAIDRIRVELAQGGIDLGKNDELLIRDGWLYVDGNRVPQELSERCIDIFEEVTGETVDPEGTSLHWNGN